MATDSAETMVENIKTRLAAKGFVFSDPGKADDMVVEIMTEFKAQIAKMVVSTNDTIVDDGAVTGSAAHVAGTLLGTGTGTVS